MQSLLRWGIENSSQQTSTGSTAVTVAEDSSTTSTSTAGAGEHAPPQPRQWDPELVQALLGRPDSELMKDALKVACDEGKDEETRLTALDDFEMLIEQIDNANNIDKMGMWKPIRQLLVSPTSSDEIRSNVLWIIGTAVQNNPLAQRAYLQLPDSPIASILSYLSPSESSSAVRSKAIYALSGLLKHNADGVRALNAEGGWDILKSALEDPEIRVRRKVVFLLNSLLVRSEHENATANDAGVPLHGPGVPASNAPVHPNSHASMTAESINTSSETARALQENDFLPKLVQGLVNPLPHGQDGDVEVDDDFEEKLVRLLFTYITSTGGRLDAAESSQLREWLQERRKEGKNWDLSESEFESLQKALV